MLSSDQVVVSEDPSMLDEALPLNAVVLLILRVVVAIKIVLNTRLFTLLGKLFGSLKPFCDTGFSLISSVVSERTCSKGISKLNGFPESVRVCWVVEETLHGCLINKDAILGQLLWMGKFNISDHSFL